MLNKDDSTVNTLDTLHNKPQVLLYVMNYTYNGGEEKQK